MKRLSTKKRIQYTPLFWMISVVRRQAKLPVALSVSEQVLQAGISVAMAAGIGQLVNVLSGGQAAWGQIWPWLLLLLLIYLASQSYILASFKDYLYQQRFEEAFDKPVLEKICRIKYKYFENAPIHDLISRTKNPSKKIQTICEDVIYTFGAWLKVLFLLLYLGSTLWWLGLISVVLAFFLSRFDSLLGHKAREMDKDLSLPEREKNYTANLLTNKNSLLEVKIFGLYKHLLQRWENWYTLIHKRRIKNSFVLMVPGQLINLPKSILLGSAVVLLGWKIHQEGGNAAVFTASIVALINFFEALDNISFFTRNMAAGNAYLGEVKQLLALEEQNEAGGRLHFPQPIREGIVFDKVTFTYPGADTPALSNVSFHIQPGERIALAGANGSGKSTLIKLLLGLYEPDSGEIRIDGIPIKEMAPAELTRGLSVVFQDYVKYSLTVKENIGFGQVERLDDLDSIRQAARLSGIDEKVMLLPGQYETPLGRLTADSQELSGGEWQKLAISRSLNRDAEVLIFDEPAASLDPVAEIRLYTQINNLLEGKTAILITHRLGSVHTCDRVIVLDQGKVVEQGHHRSLIRAGGLYSEMYSSQAHWYQEEKKYG